MANLQFTVDAETRAANAKLGAFAQDLQRTLTQAIRKLPDLEITADSSDAQKAVAQLRSEMATLANKRIGIDISAEDALAETQRLQNELRQLASTTTEVQVGADARAAAAALGDVEQRVRELNGLDAEVEVTADTAPAESRMSNFADGLKATALAAGAAAGAILIEGFQANLEMGTAKAKFEAQLGVTAEVSERLGGVAGALYANAYGESLTEVSDAVAVVVQNIKGMSEASAEEVQSITGQMMSLAQVMEVDVGEAAQAAGQMIRTGLAKDATEAMDLLAAGVQNGSNRFGDLADTMSQSSATLKQFGLSGKDSLAIIKQGLDAGAPSAEFFVGALEELAGNAGDSAEIFESLGLNAEEMGRKLTGGGAGAREALVKLMDALRAIDDPAVRSTALVSLFGEEATAMQEALLAIDPSKAVAGLENVAGAASKIDSALGATAEAKILALQRGFQQWGASMVAADGPLGDISAHIAAFGPTALAAVGAIAPLVLALQMKGAVQAVAGTTAAVGGLGAAGAASGGMLARGFAGLGALLFHPITLAIGAAAAITMIWANDQQEAAQKVAAHKAAVDALSGTLDKYTGAVTAATREETSKDISQRKLADGTTSFADGLKSVGISLRDYTDAATGNEAALQKVNSQLFSTAASLPKVRELYSSMKGDLDAGGVSFETFTAAAIGNGEALAQVARAMGMSADQGGALDSQLARAAGTTRDLGSALGTYSGTLKEAQQQARDAASANQNFSTTLDAIKAGLAGLANGAAPTQAMSDAFKDLASSAGLAATKAAESAAQFGGVTAGAAAARSSMEGSRAAFIAAAEGAGVASARANELADTIGLIPLKAETEFILNANTDPATQKVTATVQMADGSIGTMTLDGNPTMVNGKITQAVTFADGSTGVVTIDGRPDPATGKINATVQYGNGQTATIQVQARDNGANSTIDYLARDRFSTIYVQYGGSRVTAGGGVFGYDGGGIVGFAGGGMAGKVWRKPSNRSGMVNPGYRPGVDSVPTLTSPGEAVLVPELVKRLGAGRIIAANIEASGGRPPTIAGNLASIMDGTIKGYAGGGVVAPVKGSTLTLEQAKAGWFQHTDGSFDNINNPKWDHPGLEAWKKATRAAAIESTRTVTIPEPPAGGGGIGNGSNGPVAVIDEAVKSSIEALREDVTKGQTGRQQLAALAAIFGALGQWRSGSSDRCEDSRRRSTRGAW